MIDEQTTARMAESELSPEQTTHTIRLLMEIRMWVEKTRIWAFIYHKDAADLLVELDKEIKRLNQNG